jgi:hypothetical protein
MRYQRVTWHHEFEDEPCGPKTCLGRERTGRRPEPAPHRHYGAVVDSVNVSVLL